MKKGLRLLLVGVLALTFIVPGEYAKAEEAQEQTEQYQMARAMLDGIVGTQLFPGNMQDPVSRGEFVSETLRLFQIDAAASGKTPVFSDVVQNHEYFSAIQTAYDLKWVSAGNTFDPGRAITVSEAVKIILSAANYQQIAMYQGGYPTGYLLVAKSLALLSGVQPYAEQAITREDGVILFYNLLNADAFELVSAGEKTIYQGGRRNNLAAIYDMYFYDGVITSTTYNSLLPDMPISKSGMIAIDGEACQYGEMDAELLGKHVRAACRKVGNDISVACVYPTKNDECMIKCDALNGIDGLRVSYYESGSEKERKITLDGSYATIYNGRRVARLEDEMLSGSGGSIRLLDNDKDGVYEVIFIDQYQYGILTSVDHAGKYLGLRDHIKAETVRTAIDLGVQDNYLSVRNFAGENMELFELTQGSVVAVKQSRDLLYNEVIVCDNTVSGNVTAISRDTDTIEIDGTSYRMTTYFKEQYLETMQAGAFTTLTLWFDDMAISADSQSAGFMYGFLVEAAASGTFNETLKLRLFDSKGSFTVYDTCEKVQLDGERAEAADVMRAICEDGKKVTPQILRFSLNADGKINRLDTAAEGGDNTFEQPQLDDDCLTAYSFGGRSLMYKRDVRSFPGYCNVSRATVFKIPNDLEQEELFAIWNDLRLGNDSWRAITAYNLDENGFAEAILIRSDENGVQQTTESIIVESTSDAINQAGDRMLKINGWQMGKFVSYYLDTSEVAIQKISGNALCCGDIIRADIDANGMIKDMIIDFDAQDATFSSNSSNGGQPFNGGNAQLMYQEGGLYSVGSGMLYLSSTIKEPGELVGGGDKAFKKFPTYDYSFGSLRNFRLNTTNIVLCDRERKTLRPITEAELKAYLGYGEDEHYVILRQNAFSAVCMYVYE